MSDDQRIAYLNARKAYGSARAVFTAHADLVFSVGQQLSRQPGGFYSATVMRQKTGGIHTAYDLSRWPSADDLVKSATALNEAFEQCRAHWNELDVDDRAGCVPPPTSLGSA